MEPGGDLRSHPGIQASDGAPRGLTERPIRPIEKERWTWPHLWYSSTSPDPEDGELRKDPREKRLYIGVPDAAAVLEQVTDAGGSVDVPRFEVPGVVVLGLFRDPAGNPMGLVEMDGDEPRIP